MSDASLCIGVSSSIHSWSLRWFLFETLPGTVKPRFFTICPFLVQSEDYGSTGGARLELFVERI